MKKRKRDLDEILSGYADVQIGKKRKRELDEILSGYADVLNGPGPDSTGERAYLEKCAQDPEALALLRSARAVKALFESFGDFPDVGAAKVAGRGQRKAKRK